MHDNIEENHEEKYEAGKITLVNIISFLLGFSSAVMMYTVSSYFKEVTEKDNVSIFYLVAYLVVLFSFLNLHKLVKKIGKSLSFFIFLATFASSGLALFFLPVFWAGAVMLVINIILFNLCYLGKDIILESFSTDKLSGRIRGLNLTITNLGFILGPFVSTQLLEKFGFKGIFLVQFVFISAIFIISLKGLRGMKNNFKSEITVKELLSKMLKRRNIMRIYYISLVLEFFYFAMVVYVPIYLRNLDMSWSSIGIIFSVMLIPFVLFEYPAGMVADKWMGEKELIIVALIIMSISTGTVFFVASSSVFVWGGILFITRIGASLIEILRDSYFYKRIDGEDVDVINFFRTARSSGFLVASLATYVLLLFVDLRYIFILIAIVVFSALWPAANLVDNKCEDECE